MRYLIFFKMDIEFTTKYLIIKGFYEIKKVVLTKM